MPSDVGRSGRERSRVRARAGVVVATTCLVLAACSSGSESTSSSPGGTDRTDDTGGRDDAVALSVDCRAGFDVEAAGPPEDPQYGGTLSYGIEAETDGWNAASDRWALAGNLIASTFYDTLAKPAADGTIVPYLAESIEPDDDYLVWTITAREGVQFHDGTPLDAEALQANLDAIRAAVLTAPALSNIDEVVVTGPLTVEVRMNEPWVPFPQYLTAQVGVVMAPAMLDGSSSDPIGTGPFEFSSWVPGDRLSVERNDDYWRSDDQGNQLPYLDGIDFLTLADPTTRKASFDAGQIDVMHTFTADQINDLRARGDAGEVNSYESCAWGEDEEFLLMYNNGAPPFDDPVAREAVARAIDRNVVIETLFGDTFEVATGPWSPGSPWHLPPDDEDLYDPERARMLAEEYEATHGEPLRFTLRAPASIPEAIQSQQLTQQFLEEVGIGVDLEVVEFAQYLADAVLGNYQANIWRQFGSVDPDGEYVWWHPDNVSPPGELSLNIARIDDAEMGAALDRGRGSDDPDERYEAYAEVQRRFRENFYLGWTAHAFWTIAAQSDVQDLVNWTAPDGTQGLPLSGGVHPLAQVWLVP